MKKLSIAAAALLCFSAPTLAFDKEKIMHSERGDIYFGVSASRIDADGFRDAARAVGANLGVNLLNKPYGTIALDTFFGRTIDAATNRNNTETDVNLAGGFLAYRSPKKIFGKAKAGMVLTELEVEGGQDSDGSEFAWGLGVGAEIYYGVDIELEYTEVDEVEAISISLILGD